ncbi:MAG: 2-C-methyl-D-erythritol 4-phosphate cytidylyltransferase [Burkholderiales bacterium]|nr:2-C-methyl-D-erythritol 4-phosphate cytidylyltransferase [Burkholderiales bacterium]
MSLYALIPAAGRGTRIAAETPKQYVRLAGRAMLWHAAKALCVPRVEAVFVVLAPDDREFAANDWSELEGRIAPLYCGGETRRDSVYNGLVAAMGSIEADDWILVHDAARPCLPFKDLDALIRDVENDGVGGILALPIADTVKKTGKDEAGVQRVAGTEDRSLLWLAQTPQMFRAGLLAQALSRPGTPTDEAAAVEGLGLKPRIVAGSRENLKVTWPEDLAIAEAILKGRA